MNRLLEIGFHTAGRWQLVDGELSLELLRHGTQKNILCAFVSDGDVKYVGKTVQPLAKRLYGYKNPGPSQSTNIRNNALIKELLRSGAVVDILALPDNGLLHYGIRLPRFPSERWRRHLGARSPFRRWSPETEIYCQARRGNTY
jgi:hypothetical protein